jgi:hypothetical protein
VSSQLKATILTIQAEYLKSSLGINTRGPYRFSEVFSIAIYKKSDILNLKKLVGYFHPNKVKRLETLSQNFINTYKL